MGKTDFSKAEEAWSEGLQKMTRSELLQQADAAQGKSPVNKETKARGLLVRALQADLKKLYRLDKDIYKKLGVKRKDFETLLMKFQDLNGEQWDQVVQVKTRVDLNVKELAAKGVNDEQLVEQQRHKHINKRFNVSDKWLPLK